MPRKTFFILFALAAIMRVFLIGRAPLWYDENFTLILARLPFDRMIAATAGDVHPPLWYLIEWLLFHALPFLPAWAIRIPALIFSLLAFWMFAKLIIVLQLPERTGTAALFLMSILPMQVWYAQEGRMYAMLEFLALAALYAGLTRRWTWFTIAAISLCYTQNYGLIYCAVIGFLLLVTAPDQYEAVLVSGLVTVLAWLPWAFVILEQMTEIQGRYWIVDAGPGAVLGAVYKQFWASAMLEPGIIGSYFVTFVVLLLGVYVMMRERITSWWIVMTMTFAPVGIAWLASMLWQPMLLFRPLIGIAPFLYIIVAAPLSFDLRPRVKLYAACFVAPVMLFGIVGYYQNIAAMKGEGATSPLTTAFDYVRANWHDGDVIYYTDDGAMINLMPYTDLPQYKLQTCAPVLGALSDKTRMALDIRIADLADVPHTRAWVFAPRSPLHPACYEDQIKDIAPEGKQLITVDDNKYISSGVWLVDSK